MGLEERDGSADPPPPRYQHQQHHSQLDVGTLKSPTGSFDSAVRILVEEATQCLGLDAEPASTANPEPAVPGALRPAGGPQIGRHTNGLHYVDEEYAAFGEMVRKMRAAFRAGRSRSYDSRMKNLKGFLRMLEENEDEICNALYQDLRKCKWESSVMEIEWTKNDTRDMIFSLKEWMEPEKPKKSLKNMLDQLVIYKEPYGVVLVLGSWNYPFHLTLVPAVGAIGCGNCVIIKPSELSAASSAVMAKLIPKYMDQDCFKVVLGGIEETTELLKQQFDYIFYTGSTAVGKIIGAAANKHLTPVTLELGGKSPVIVGESFNVDVSVKRILWGKFLNSGQTCVAPDYLLCTAATQEKFVKRAKEVLVEFYGTDPKKSPDFGRIVSDRHFQRVAELLEGGYAVAGGDMDASQRYIGPTILVNVKPSDKVMQQEIFGPILPILTVKDTKEAVAFVNSRDNPLALYIFTEDASERKFVLENTTSGNACVNETMLHMSADGLPFGGVGASGIGAYHGKYSFETFSHSKGVLIRDTGIIGETLIAARYAPHTVGRQNFINFLLRRRRAVSLKYLPHALLFGLGYLASELIFAFVTGRKSYKAES